MASQPSPRRFQFRLRTLMIAVTLFCVVGGGYIGQQVEIVRTRKVLLDRIINNGSWYVTAEGFTSTKTKVRLGGLNLYDQATGKEIVLPAVSWFRRLLGDKGVERIGTPLSDPLIEEIRAAFPEAIVAGHIISKPKAIR